VPSAPGTSSAPTARAGRTRSSQRAPDFGRRNEEDVLADRRGHLLDDLGRGSELLIGVARRQIAVDVAYQRVSDIEDWRRVRRGQAGCSGLLHAANDLTERAAAVEELVDERIERVGDGEGRLIGHAFQSLWGEEVTPDRRETSFVRAALSSSSPNAASASTAKREKGTVVQDAGRLHRAHAVTRDIRIEEYVDAEVPVLRRMYAKRLRTYREIGLHLRRGARIQSFRVSG